MEPPVSSDLVDDLPIATIEDGPLTFRIKVPSLEDHIGKHLLDTGAFYEAELLAALKSVVNAGSTLVDVGANIGNHTIYFAGVLQCDVVAIEPVPVTANILKSNILLNNLSDRVKVHEVALGDLATHAEIAVFDEKNYGGTSLRECADGNIRVMTLDELLPSGTVGLIKIDAEGMDYQVLQGAREILHRDMPVVVIEAMTDEAFIEVDGFLDPLGYSLVGQYNATPTYIYMATLEQAQLRRAVSFLGLSTAHQGVVQRSQEAHLRQVGRYAERLSKETYERIVQTITKPPTDASHEADTSEQAEPSSKSAILRQELDRVSATLQAEREAFTKLAEKYEDISTRVLRFENELSVRSEMLSGWQELEVSVRDSELQQLNGLFSKHTGRPIQDAVGVVQTLETETLQLNTELEKVVDENKKLIAEVRMLIVSRGEYGRRCRSLSAEISAATKKIQRLRAENSKLRDASTEVNSRNDDAEVG